MKSALAILALNLAELFHRNPYQRVPSLCHKGKVLHLCNCLILLSLTGIAPEYRVLANFQRFTAKERLEARQYNTGRKSNERDQRV